MVTHTAVIYARVSDRKQAEEDISVPAQIELAEGRARDLDAAVLQVFTDGGKSAFREANRRKFEAAVEYAVLMQATYFITWSSSRFARNQLESVLYKRELDRAGVKLVYVSMAIDRATDEGWLVDGVLGLIDEMQSRQNAKDTKRSMMRNAQCGFWGGGRTPFGYVSEPAPENPKRRKLQLIPADAAVVRSIFASRVAGFGAKAIAEDLNIRGLRNRTSLWSKSSVLALLRNEVYIGAVVFNRKDRRTAKLRPRDQWVIVQSHEPIVDVDLWNQVQEQMNDAAERSEGSSLSRHAFTGLLRCGECGASLQIETARGRSRNYAYYNCRANQAGKGCVTRRLRADVMDDWLSNIILERVLSRENMIAVARAVEDGARTKVVERDQIVRQLQGEVRGLKERNSKLYELLEMHGREAPNLGDLTERLQGNLARIREAEKEITGLDTKMQQRLAVTEREIGILSDTLRELLAIPDNAAKARAFYGSFISRIVIKNKTAEIRYDPTRLLARPLPVHSKTIWLPERATLRTGFESRCGAAVRVLVANLPCELARAA